MKTTTELMKIALNGGNLIIDAQGKSTTALMEIVSMASASKVHVTIRNAGAKSTLDLKRIASLGPTYVTFDFTTSL